MKKKINYKKAPKEIAEAIEASQIIDDFLPPPANLVLKDLSVKITVDLSVPNAEFLKENAQKLGIPLKQMIKNILDNYVEYFHEKPYKVR
ncbi:Uncharacterized protein dnl_25720 [Desulfonema limicola]|uniref:CopG family transcriptional regulator n=1 Tax=Desulfonema limicola TaxID=45656 RepID=A0A975B7F9_9BACT|nr:CopG family transcriptional regulator [Desulfonema limicola]QTA80275.1 Uncharacterized protein dnl_25720 [Desulfonema limicola]